jgi:hypothetical protein
VFDLSVRRTKPLAMMPFAKLGPDREHALEAHRRTVGFPSFGLRPASHHFMSALSKPIANS